MNWILKFVSPETLVRLLCRLFYGITPGMLEAAKDLVQQAEDKFSEPGSGEEKRKWVITQMKTIYYSIRTAAIDYAITQILGLANAKK